MSMSKTELLKLQNGSDVRGIACEGIENEHVTLTSEAAYLIGRAFAIWLLKKKNFSPFLLNGRWLAVIMQAPSYRVSGYTMDMNIAGVEAMPQSDT